MFHIFINHEVVLNSDVVRLNFSIPCATQLLVNNHYFFVVIGEMCYLFIQQVMNLFIHLICDNN